MRAGCRATLVAVVSLLAFAAPAAAASPASDPFALEAPWPGSSWRDAPSGARISLPVRLAQAGEGQDGLAMHAGPAPEEHWHAPWITGNKLHQYLGIGSLVAAGLAAFTAPGDDDGGGGDDDEGGGFHHTAGWTAAVLGGAAVGTGLVFHLDDIRLRDGILDPDNLHALLGVLATAAYFAAVNKAPNAGHGSMGELGAVAMLVSIKLAW